MKFALGSCRSAFPLLLFGIFCSLAPLLQAQDPDKCANPCETQAGQIQAGQDQAPSKTERDQTERDQTESDQTKSGQTQGDQAQGDQAQGGQTKDNLQNGTISVSILATEPRRVLRDLAQRGISFQTMLVNDWSKSLQRGTDSDQGYGRYSLDFSATLDGGKLVGVAGSTGFIRLKQHLSEFGGTYDGSAQVYSNIDAPSRSTLYEAWVEQRLMSDKLRLRVGKIDATNDFATVATAGDFLNSSMGYTPTIQGFPTYPEPKFGVNAFLRPLNGFGIGMGVFQTAGTGALTMLEPNHSWNLAQRELPGRLSVGYWRLDGTLLRFDGSRAANSQGLYSVLEQAVWRQSMANGSDSRRLSAFLQLGYADGRLNPFTQHTGGGLVLQAPFAQRPQDAVGVAATQVRFSGEPAAGFDQHTEMVFETYYKITVNRHMLLVQDFQFIHNPGGLHANADCPVVTPRVVISF